MHTNDSAHSMGVTVVIVAPVRLYGEGLARMLAAHRRASVITVATADAAIDRIRELQPDVVVVDVAARESFALIKALRRENPRPRIVAFAVEEDSAHIIASAEAGADGYVTADASLEELDSALERVEREELMCSPRVAAILFRRIARNPVAPAPHEDTLTIRERQVWALIGQGLSNKEIAGALNISVLTVKNHVHHLLGKLNVSTRSQAAVRTVLAPMSPLFPRDTAADKPLTTHPRLRGLRPLDQA